jgi:predicted nucleotidyltransferase component of viral defense system
LVKSTLNNLQNNFLREFFKRENSFFLTGGAALAGFYLGHRKTEDLDFFTLENEIENGARIVKDVANILNATVEAIQTSPDFRRFLIKRENESVVIDLVRDCVYQINREKNEIKGIRIDSPQEILANKLCALNQRFG